MCGLHCLLHHCYHLLAQVCQIYLTLQHCAEALNDSARFILLPIETPVNCTLEAMTQRLEERGNDQGRTDQDERRLPRLGTEGGEPKLRTKDHPGIQQGQDGSEQGINQRASDKHIDIESIGIQNRHQDASDIDPTAKEASDIDDEQGQRVCWGYGG